MAERDGHIVWFEQTDSADTARVGGKNASLGEMIRSLKGEGVRVPDGYATTAAAYCDYLAANGVDRDSADLAELFDERDKAVESAIRDVIQRAHVCDVKVGICG